MNLSSEQISSLIILFICVLILILLNVFGNRGSGPNDTSDWNTDDFDID